MSQINPMWTAYNNLYNEGGEGYNPHSQHIDQTPEPVWSQLMDRQHKVERIMDATSIDDPRYAELATELVTLKVAIKIDMEG